MPYLIPSLGLAYFSVPKVACTSIKHMLFTIEHGRPYTAGQTRRGKPIFIHRLYPSVPFSQVDHAGCADLFRFAVLRDPVQRVLSAYGNRVLGHRELSEKKAGTALRAAGLPTNPDLSTFIARLREYCDAVRSIRHHTLPLVHFLGQDPAYFDRLYRFSELDLMTAELCQRTDRCVDLPWLQVKGTRIPRDALVPAEIRALQTLYEADYAVFGPWFDHEARNSSSVAVKASRLGT